MAKLLMFPGQGSQYPTMGKDWYENFAVAQRAFEEGSDGCGLNLKKLCFEGSVDDLKQTEVTQPALLTTTIAIFRSIQSNQELKWDYLAGHSLGEYSALCAAGSVSLLEAAKLVRNRGKYMQEAVPAGTAGMSALVFKPGAANTSELAMELCSSAQKKSGQKVSVANYNSPEQIVIAGHLGALEAAAALVGAEPRFCVRKVVPLPVSAPFHSELMAPAAERLAPELTAAKWNSVASSYVANVDAQIYDLHVPQAIPLRLIDQITGSVRWVDTIKNVINNNCLDAVEIGPGTVLCGLAKRIKVGDVILNTKNVDKFEEYKNGGSI